MVKNLTLLKKRSPFLITAVIFISCSNQEKSGLYEVSKVSFKLEELDLKSTNRYQTINRKFPEENKLSFVDEVETFTVNYNSDGLNIKGYLAQPKEEGKFPLIIFCRGGNRSFGELIDDDAIFLNGMASNGYVVLASNYRGSTGSEGQDEFGGKDVNDVINLYRISGQLDKVDTNSIFFLGASRGSIMVYQSLKKLRNDKNIKAAVVIAGASDLNTLIYDRPEMEERVFKQLIPNYSQNKEQALSYRSVINWVDSLPKHVPILLLHGDQDQKVSVAQSINLSKKLEESDIQHRLVVFKGDGHGLRNSKDSVIVERENWFNQFRN